ncbi:hypothetical protein C1701_13900 [Actinoalloteichus sp. AHMU CJ021]|nr:hypothetical protein C1701_13900 [Actinoalloteichus sp. AHMU CJ021]
MAAQSRVNGELAGRLGSGVAAAVVSFGTGLLLVALFALASPTARRGLGRVLAALRSGGGSPGSSSSRPRDTTGSGARAPSPAAPGEPRLRWWHCLGGLCGAFLVLSQGLTVGSVGVAVFTVAVVAGQVTSGMVVDRLGVGPGGKRPVTWLRMVGAVIALCAVVIAMSGELSDPSRLGLAVLPALAGVAIAWQQAVNGQVGVVARSPLPPTLVNFVVGLTGLLVALAVLLVLGDRPAPLPAEPVLYVGGPLGVLFIAIGAVAVRHTGVLVFAMSAVAGQLSGAVLLDLVLPATDGPMSVATLAGSALTLLGAVLAVVPGRTRRGRGLER